MKTCNNCLLDEKYPQISFNDNDICSLCYSDKKFKPIGEDQLLNIFQSARNKNAQYDALVPLSGGKDSTYILHLAVNVYKLNILAMTYDNGLFSQLALDNIDRAIKITGVKHIFCKPDFEIQKMVYQNMLKYTGDICGACDIATKANVLKVAKDYSTPIILYGTSPLENDSFVPDSIQDISRFKHIMSLSNNLTKKQINDFLIFPKLNLFLQSLYKKTGKFSKEVRPLFFIENPSDKEMGEIIKKELGWQDEPDKEYSKHLDCIAEPLTNYLRNNIYGYERRKCQYSNMIRSNEITREKAINLFNADKVDEKPSNYTEVLKHLELTEKDIEEALSYKPLLYEKNTSKINRLYIYVIKKIRNANK
ncbi:MAG: N-acetyl sugar amidotransferase [Salinivirgaceae bacterium]|nr:N-acetyl sugar amidotransferase [Salinivirgaceae bacterium]